MRAARASHLNLLAAAVAIVLAAGTIVTVRIFTNMQTEYWMAVELHEAFLRGSQFGSDVVFTYGPWALVTGGAFHPRTAGVMFLLRTAIAFIGLLVLWQRVASSSLHRQVATAMVVLLTVVVWTCWSDTFFHFVPLLILLEGFERAGSDRKSSLYYGLIAAGALLALAKFSMLAEVWLAVTAVSLDEVRRRSPPWSAIALAAGTAVFWLVAGQELTGFLPFLRNSAELAAGYGEAMSRDNVYYTPLTLRPFLVSAAIFTIVLAAIELKRKFGAAVLMLGGWVGLLLLLFKGAFVRADSLHIPPACGALLLFQVTYLTTRYRQWPRISAILLIPIVISAQLVSVFFDENIVKDSLSSYRASAHTIAGLAGWPKLKNELTEVHDRAIAQSPVLQAPMKATLYPAPSGLIERRDFIEQSRPVFISYAVYTRRLEQLNARWLATTLPPNVLFTIDSIDQRYPSLEDGASWPVLLTRYAVSGRLGLHAILTRRVHSAAPKLVRLARIDGRLAKRVTLPAQGRDLIFARLAIDLTLKGRLETLLYKPPPLRIRVGLDDGRTKSYRLIRGMADSEFLLSPLVADTTAFVSLLEGSASPPRVLWLEADAPESSGSYRPEIRMELLRLESPTNASAVPAFQKP
jgi:hypothetical protein